MEKIHGLTPYMLEVLKEMQEYKARFGYTDAELIQELTSPPGQGIIESCLQNHLSPYEAARGVLGII